VIRGNAADPHSIELTRDVPAGALATGRRLPGGEAYIRVASFAPGTADAIRSSVASLGSAAAAGVIIDLRGTADGSAEDGVAAARLFVKSGTLATRAGRADADRVVTTAGPTDGSLTMPVILLVSNGTAHGAEVFAGAMLDTKRAPLIGEPTAGLAALQHLVQLPDGHGMWLTYARYLQADGTPIHEHGLRPTIPVDIPVVAFDEKAPSTDPVLERGVAELKSNPAAVPQPQRSAAPESSGAGRASDGPAPRPNAPGR
jgi:carboxyl-terminal processing protease